MLLNVAHSKLGALLPEARVLDGFDELGLGFKENPGLRELEMRPSNFIRVSSSVNGRHGGVFIERSLPEVLSSLSTHLEQENYMRSLNGLFWT